MTDDTTEHPPLQLPARSIPVPRSVSPEAQAFLATARGLEIADYPPADDIDGWEQLKANAEDQMRAAFKALSVGVEATVEETDVAGVAVCVITPAGLAPGRERRVLLEFHGGGLVLGGVERAHVMGVMAAGQARAITWSVAYRTPPLHPYPAALDDAMTVYRSLLEDHGPEDIIVSGGSGGGNLAAALVLRARDEGLPLPAALVLKSPEVDLTESGDSFQLNLGVDNVLGNLAPLNELYANGHDMTDPYLSPLFGDLEGFPPTYLQTGTRDLFLSNTVRMHRKLLAAGVEVELHVFEAMPHRGFRQSPEDAELDATVRAFLDAHWN